ncbi:MAG: hypothetical protein HKN23_14390, partial [Verrucomicrobiales bacterium]|nr:hypothetical protein [Verrucomicrobiales bacterium]
MRNRDSIPAFERLNSSFEPFLNGFWTESPKIRNSCDFFFIYDFYGFYYLPKHEMKTLNSVAVGLALFLGIGFERAEAQITNSEASATMLASRIAADAGVPANQYADYSRSLARTLSLLSPAKQAEVFGGTIPNGSGFGAGTGTGLSTGTGTGTG